MTKISIIAAMDEANGLGWHNQLPWHLPADLAHFKNCTLGKPIIMGRKTFDSIGRPLPKRRNIIISKTMLETEGLFVCSSLEEAILLCKEHEEVMIIGGASIYEQSIELAHQLYLTRIHHRFQSDVHFPSLRSEEWTLISSEYRTQDSTNRYDMTFQYFTRA